MTAESLDLSSAFTFKGTCVINQMIKNEIKNPQPGDTWFVADTKEVFTYGENTWIRVGSESDCIPKDEDNTSQDISTEPIAYNCPNCGGTLQLHQKKCSFCDSYISWSESDVPKTWAKNKRLPSIYVGF